MSTNSELLVRELLESAGFSVSNVPRGASRTSDFLVADDRHRYLVEVTEKNLREFQDFVKRAEPVGSAPVGSAILKRLMDRDNRVDAVLHNKTDQFRKTPVSTDFRVLAVTAIHEDAGHLWEVLFRTLYGIADLQVIQKMTEEAMTQAISDGAMDRPCLYFDHPSFKDHADLHGVMFASMDKVCMFINPFALGVGAFRLSRLYSFAVREGLIDPEVQLGPSDWFLDEEVDRNDEKAKHAALYKKYGMLTQRTRDACFEGRIIVALSRNNP